MDNNQIFNSQSTIGKFLTKKRIVAILIIVIAAELILGLWILLKPNLPNSQKTEEKITSLSLIPFKDTLKVREKVTVGVNILSRKKVDGFDVIISFDPDLLSVEATGSTEPFKTSRLFSDYPQNTVDRELGKVTVSGISTAPVTPNGLLGSVIFVAKAPGSATISIEHTPGSTTDSNVTETKTGNDILDKVENIELNIVQ